MKKFFKSIIKWIVRGAIYIWCKIYYRAEIKGLENVPKDGALIFAGNHRSYLDPPLIVATAKRDTLDEIKGLSIGDVTEYAKSICKYVDDYIIPTMKAGAVYEVGPIKESLKTLKEGNCIALFPEGTRNGLEKGEKAKDGVAFFAVRSGAKVVPCGIKGGEKGNRKVTITYGKPLDYSDLKGNKDKEVLEKVTDEIMNNIVELAK